MRRPAISVEGVSLRLGAFSLQRIGLAVGPGEILAILGPNGAGKSVTLETIAGFHRPRAGAISIGGRDVTDLPPEQRRVGFLFQNFGLFPHLSVAANVSVPLRASRKSAARQVAYLLDRFAIGHLGTRLPRDLSPGEAQRVALARALAMQPDVFLFDEPFSALDASTREMLREELRTFLREAGVPAIFVTHDQTDVSVLADRVAIMDRGTIIQDGPMADVFRAPATVSVAGFVGVENVLPGRVIGKSGRCWRVAVGDTLLRACGNDVLGGPAVSVCIRAEDVSLGIPDARLPAEGDANRLTMRVVRVVALGELCKIALDGGFPLIAYLTKRGVRDLGLVPGANASVEIEPEAIHLLAAA